MWIDKAGVAHTVALPNPADVMSTEFREGLDTLSPSDREALRDEVERWEEGLLSAGWHGSTESADLVEAVPPTALLQGSARTIEDVEAAVQRVEPQWRLDALLALGDHLD